MDGNTEGLQQSANNCLHSYMKVRFIFARKSLKEHAVVWKKSLDRQNQDELEQEREKYRRGKKHMKTHNSLHNALSFKWY